jgi:diguanylate cyclase (GGDEF)-like protein
LTELGEVRARLIAQLRCRGGISGFVEIQQCRQTRQWSAEDAATVQTVTEMLSVVVAQALDQTKMKSDAQEMKLLNEIATLFRESRGLKGHDMLVKSVRLVAEHMGFEYCQIYLFNPDEGVLEPHIGDDKHAPVEMDAKDNPFLTAYESGKLKTVNAEYSRRGDPYFGHDTALVVPLISEGERLGVLGLWSRLPNRPALRPEDKDLVGNIAGQLANIVRADQAIAQIRADQAREALINRVSEEIKQSLKEADEILETLVEALREHLDLSLTVVSLYDSEEQKFTKSKVRSDGTLGQDFDAPGFSEQLFNATLAQLKEDSNLFLTAADISNALGGMVVDPVKSATLIPLIHAGNFKAALCMVSCERQRPYGEKDMKMVSDLADRVAVVISHAELFAQVERQAVTDPMTGLYNRRYFNEQLSKEIDRYQRFGRPFSYIIIDLDFLKKINDTLGHQFGDAAIKHIANVLKKKVRDVDTAARYGGEEFVLLLPETDVKAARLAGERFCTAIRETPVEGIGVITASVGVSTFPLDAADRDKLTEMADQALYLAKHRGRNQVCSVSEDLVPSLEQRGAEALEVQQHAIGAKAGEMASIDMKLIAEHGILGIMGAIIKIIEARDAYGKDRSPRAAELATKLAQALHLSKDHQTIISLSAILHNIGKINLPEELLQKKGPLTEDERKLIEQSPTLGAKILEPAKHLHRVATVIEAYQEHYDGSGYPKKLKGEEIPLESRIICLIESYLAMTSDRPYRKALSHDEAVQQLKEGAGKQYDPRLVKLFLGILQKEATTARK